MTRTKLAGAAAALVFSGNALVQLLPSVVLIMARCR
jgi:hypothetical protein